MSPSSQKVQSALSEQVRVAGSTSAQSQARAQWSTAISMQ